MRKHFKKLRSKSKDTFHNILDKIKYICHTIILFFKEKGKWRKIKRLISNIHKFLKRKHIYSMLLFIIIYLTMSISTKIFAKDISFSGYDEVIPKLFTIGYISLFLGIIYS